MNYPCSNLFNCIKTDILHIYHTYTHTHTYTLKQTCVSNSELNQVVWAFCGYNFSVSLIHNIEHHLTCWLVGWLVGLIIFQDISIY